MLDFLLQIDRDIFLFFNGLNHAWLDPVMYWISEKRFWIPFYALLLYFVIRHYGWKSLIILVLVALLITMADQLSGLLKNSTQRFRPSQDPSLEGLVHLVRDRRGGQFGFVSAHAANSFALATFMIFLLKKHIRWIAPVLISWAAIKSYSRIYLGVHYPGDVIGGALLGIFCALLIIAIWKWIVKRYYSEKITARDQLIVEGSL
jgi:undecaprenyl-diphosphatase